MNIFWSQFRSYLVIALTLLLLGAFSYFFIIPLYRDNQRLLDGIQSMGVDGEIVASENKRLNSFQEQLVFIKEHSDDLAVTASSDDPVQWVRELEKLAKETGNRIRIESDESLTPKSAPPAKSKTAASKSTAAGTANDQAEPTPTPTAADKKKAAISTLAGELPSDQGVGIRILLDGDYRSVTLFLHKLELFRYYIDVLSFKYTKNLPDEKSAYAGSAPGVTPTSSVVEGNGSLGVSSPNSKPETTSFYPLSAVFGSVVYTTKK